MEEEADKPHRQNNNLSLLSRIGRPKGWAGIAATVAFIIATLLVCNLIAYYYLEKQPTSSYGPEANQAAYFTLPYWYWLIDSHTPVDTIILGDSAAHCNLLPGPIADRLGGNTISLANNAGSSLLMDAWMLQYYVDKFGPPRNVILLRNCSAYEEQHNLEYMSVVPLKWGYWDRLGVAPNWKAGEEAKLFVSKYCVLYSRSDILSARLTHPLKLFAQPRSKYRNPETDRTYSRGVPVTIASELDQISRETTPSLYSKFSPCSDSTNALKAMTGLANRLGFQFYIAIGSEWDKLYQDPGRQAKVSAMQQWLAQFTDPQYVHLLPSIQTFRAEQMQHPNHLRPNWERLYTETILADIVAIQNRLAATQSKPIQLTSAVLDKSNYNPGEQPTVTLSLTTSASLGTSAMIKGDVSCLVRSAGNTDGQWTARSSAVDYTMQNSGNTEVRLVLGIGKLVEAGAYDVVLFLRQDVGGLSFETRVELPNTIEVK